MLYSYISQYFPDGTQSSLNCCYRKCASPPFAFCYCLDSSSNAFYTGKIFYRLSSVNDKQKITAAIELFSFLLYNNYHEIIVRKLT